MESIVLQAIITATSDKQSEHFAVNRPQKSIYLEMDQENTTKAKDFGLPFYTSREDKKEFTIVKASEKISLYYNNAKVGERSGVVTDDNPNFHSNESTVNVSIIKAKSKTGQTYFRLHAINGDIQNVEERNPFA